MTEEDEKTYTTCKNYRGRIESWHNESNNHVKHQHFGCGSHAPLIEHTLEVIHRQLKKDIEEAYGRATQSVTKIIEQI